MQSDTAFGGGNADSQAVTIPDRQTDKLKIERLKKNERKHKENYGKVQPHQQN